MKCLRIQHGYADSAKLAHKLWLAVLDELMELRDPERDINKGTSAEILGAHLILQNPRANLIYARGRGFNYRYMVAEMLWNLCHTWDVEPLKRVFPGVLKFIEDQGPLRQDVVDWAYGPWLQPKFHRALLELQQSPSSRRAIIAIDHPVRVQGTPPCLDSIQWFIRGGQLVQITRMRSNDAWLGLPLDMYQFSMWQLMMASALGVEVGPYHHFADSLHFYERDYEAYQKMLAEGNIGTQDSTVPDPNAIIQVTEQHLRRLLFRGGMQGENGFNPWLHAYHGEVNRGPYEFRFLKECGYGQGW